MDKLLKENVKLFCRHFFARKFQVGPKEFDFALRKRGVVANTD